MSGDHQIRTRNAGADRTATWSAAVAGHQPSRWLRSKDTASGGAVTVPAKPHARPWRLPPTRA
ncbi:hypothetical protein AB5J72_51085 [Streptomyces sp. CG1]|uniref:hypothetical protein n=1 Tax=Streptomyces sp. CG1 TaxID=1287523 RepID=UPI0034E2FBC5